MSVDVYEVICKINVRSFVHLTVRTLSYVNRPTSRGPLRRPPSRSAELRTMPEVGRKCLESAHFRLTSFWASPTSVSSVHFGSLTAHFGPLLSVCAIHTVPRSCPIDGVIPTYSFGPCVTQTKPCLAVCLTYVTPNKPTKCRPPGADARLPVGRRGTTTSGVRVIGCRVKGG